MRIFLATLAAYAGLLAGRIASEHENHEWVGWSSTAEDAIEAGREFMEAWKSRA